MEILWCEEHQASLDDPTDSMCLKASYVDDAWQTDCRIIHTRLVPDGAIVIERGEGEGDGRWPESALKAIDDLLDGAYFPPVGLAPKHFLDALASVRAESV